MPSVRWGCTWELLVPAWAARLHPPPPTWAETQTARGRPLVGTGASCPRAPGSSRALCRTGAAAGPVPVPPGRLAGPPSRLARRPRRIESYSCKMAGDDKHMFKQFCQEGQPHVLEALSPPQTTGISPSRYGGTAAGPLPAGRGRGSAAWAAPCR